MAGYTTNALRKYCDCFVFDLRMFLCNSSAIKFWAAQNPGNGKTALCGWLRTCAVVARMVSAYVTNVANVLRIPPNFIRKSFAIHSNLCCWFTQGGWREWSALDIGGARQVKQRALGRSNRVASPWNWYSINFEARKNLTSFSRTFLCEKCRRFVAASFVS